MTYLYTRQDVFYEEQMLRFNIPQPRSYPSLNRLFVVWLQGTTAEEESEAGLPNDSHPLPLKTVVVVVLLQKHFGYSASVLEEESRRGEMCSALLHFVEDFTVVLFLSRERSSAPSCLHCRWDSMSPAHYAGGRS